MPKGSMPALVGVGQTLSQWDAAKSPDNAPSPLSLAVAASRRALSDAGIDASAIDTIAAVRTFEDSIPGDHHPHGHNTNLPGTIARDLGAAPQRAIYDTVGGQSPQALANEIAARIHAGEIDCALIAGAEASRASKTARKHGVELDWADGDGLAIEDRGMGERLLSRYEIKHGLVKPAYFYALFENAMAARDRETRSQRRATMSALLTKFAAVAATNPYAQFPTPRSADFLSQPSADNYPFADPYLKWHMAQDAVNQGAAMLIMSEAKADALGVAPAKRVYLHGGGEASDSHVSLRPKLDGSSAMDAAINRALTQAGKTSADMHAFDLYSCFPCAVFSALSVLGIAHETETRPLTMTGGLPFFGGPGNNYSLHAIASMAGHLRAAPGQFGLVLANGGWMSKQAAGVWSATRPRTYAPIMPPADTSQTPSIPLLSPSHSASAALPSATGAVETYTLVHAKSAPVGAIIFARTDSGERFIAVAAPDAMARLLADESPVGSPVTITAKDEVNTFSFV